MHNNAIDRMSLNNQLYLGRLYKLGRVDFEEYCEDISNLSQGNNAGIVTE